MRAVLQDDLSGAPDASDKGRGDRVGAHVVATADDERGYVDLSEAVPHVPAPERARDSPLVRPLHRAVDIGRLLRPHSLQLRPWLRAAIKVAIQIGLHRPFVLRVVVGPRTL